jgi:hypothetical protein
MAGTSRLVKLVYKSLLRSYTKYESYFAPEPNKKITSYLQANKSRQRSVADSDTLPGNSETLPISSIDVVRLSFRANMEETDPTVRIAHGKFVYVLCLIFASSSAHHDLML